jgi:tRNA (cytidine/uridine-2'-O-)-methyltransferase
MTRYGKVPPSDIDFKEASKNSNIYLIFGKESTGIPGEILRANLDRCFRIPMNADCRCLNLSNACAVAIYEVLRQLGYPGLSFKEEQKGEDFLEQNYSYDETLRRKQK